MQMHIDAETHTSHTQESYKTQNRSHIYLQRTWKVGNKQTQTK